MSWNMMLERASILRFSPGISSSQQGESLEESPFFISSLSPILTTHRPPTILHLKAFTSSKPNPNFHHPSPFSPHFSSNSTPFALSYLIHNLGFSPQFASKLSSTYNLRFKTSHNPDLVLNFFRNHGVSDSQLRHMVSKEPWLLTCDPTKRVFPKFHFFLSKGVSTSDIIKLFVKFPKILSPSLDNRIVPAYEFLTTFFQSQNDFVAFAIRNPILFTRRNVLSNVKMLIQIEVPEPRILALLRLNSEVLFTHDLMKMVEEVKQMGFHPSQYNFAIALHAKTIVDKPHWKKKVDAFEKWGWRGEDVLEAFRKHPHCMLVSVNKINLVMDFWVNQMGWDALAIANLPRVLVASMERKIMPRAYVMQYLRNKGLRKDKASLTSPLLASDQTFIDRYIMPFKEDSSYLLKLYEEKLNLASDKDNKDGMI